MISGSALRKQNHSISFSIQRCQTPGTKDSYTHPTTPSAGRTGGVLTCLINYTRNRNGAITIPVIFMASFFHPGISATLI